jgi:hypothetical protein
MANKGRRGGGIEDLPHIEQSRFGVNVIGGSWVLFPKEKFETWRTADRLECTIYASGAAHGDTHTEGWKLTIVKPRTERGELGTAWQATLSRGDVAGDVMVLRGATRGWADIITILNIGADLPAAMRATGAAVYGRDGAKWFTVRPFKVVWPWRNAHEPNARYSEFRLVAHMNIESMGEFVSVYHGQAGTYATRKICEELGANAFLDRTVDSAGNETWDARVLSLVTPVTRWGLPPSKMGCYR